MEITETCGWLQSPRFSFAMWLRTDWPDPTGGLSHSEDSILDSGGGAELYLSPYNAEDGSPEGLRFEAPSAIKMMSFWDCLF